VCSFVHDAPSAVSLFMLVGCTIMGLSHILQPGLWRELFVALHGLGRCGVLARVFLFDLWPALIVVVLHPVWSGPGIVVTIYGWLLLGKVALSLLSPAVGLKSLGLAAAGDRGFMLAGMALLALAGAAGASLIWPSPAG
jgi:hypothetical protein